MDSITSGVIQAWGRILTGYRPSLSIEITRECPLRCPGCYAYGDDHLGGDLTLRELRDYKGQELIDGMIALIHRRRRAARPLSRAERAAADAGRARHSRAARHERRSPDSP